MQQTIACLIYYTVVVFIPLKETYLTLKNQANESQTLSLWANYWAIFSLIVFVQSYLGFFTYQPFTFLFMVFFLWSYHSDYKGALYISQKLKSLISSNPVFQNVKNQINQHAKFLNLFQNEPANQENKEKTH